MNINFTFLVQLFNFFIAYSIIERFFLRPAVGIVQQESSSLEVAQKNIVHAQKTLEEQKKALALQWLDFQHTVRTVIPKLISLKPLHEHAGISRETRPLSDIEKMIQEVTQSIVTKVRSDA